MDNDLSKKIRDLRISNNDSQESLSKKLNVSRQTISKWETGISCPDFSTVILIANLYGSDMNYFVDEQLPTDRIDNRKMESLFILDNPYFKIGMVICTLIIAPFAGPLSLLISMLYLLFSIHNRKKTWTLIFLLLVLMGV
ncbi:MAG: helix-turn-helix transcriptional regulator [Erysipelothrix sp.]|nr:helix-turn-helix transcriptional regulator [Erysipelothrix sp.]